MKSLAARIGLLVLLGAGLNAFYEHFEWRSYLFTEASQYLQIEKISRCDAVYFAASDNFSQPGDTDHRKVSQMLAAALPHWRVDAVNQPASHARTHLRLMSCFADESNVKTIVATMNLRSLGPAWRHSELENALLKSEVMYNRRPPLFNRLLVSLNAYPSKLADERKADLEAEWNTDFSTTDGQHRTVNSWKTEVRDNSSSEKHGEVAVKFVEQYGFVATEENPRVRDYDNMVKLASERGWKLVFVLLPEDVEKARTLVGEELSQLMVNNAGWLEQRYEKFEHVQCVNAIALLPTTCFTDTLFPTEHYNAAGREKLATAIADKLHETRFYP